MTGGPLKDEFVPPFFFYIGGKNSPETDSIRASWGATTFPPQLKAAVLLTASPRASRTRIRNIPHDFARCLGLSGLKRHSLGVQLQPWG